jgi:hypothetical protein
MDTTYKNATILQHVSPYHRGRPEFDSKSVHVDLGPNQVALGRLCPSVMRFSSVTTTPPMLHTNLQVDMFIRWTTLFG